MMSGQWIAIIICLAHSAIFSGLNLGFFGLSRLRLVVQAETDNQDAQRILNLRKDAHLLLATLLWGNVASNVLLALFAESIFSGVGAFLFSTVGITFFGEIFPQAYLAKHALRASMVLVPLIRFYQCLLYPIVKPTGYLLDRWLGKEQIGYFEESELEVLLHKHGQSKRTDLEVIEATGAINFLKIDDVFIEHEGENIHPRSIIEIDDNASPVFPAYEADPQDAFLQRINESEEKWVVFVDPANNPVLVLNVDQFLRDVLYKANPRPILAYCHKPIVIRDPDTQLGKAILQFKVKAESLDDDVVDDDVIIFWNEKKRIITGADILGRLLRGIVSCSGAVDECRPREQRVK
jgi:metal transporter CNNM